MPLAILALKLTLVPLLIVGMTLAGRRWGPAVAGWLTGLPIVAGPIMFFIAFEQGAAFAERAIVGMLLGVLAVLSSNLAYAWCATRWSWPGSVACSLCVYALAVALLSRVDVSLLGAAAVVLVSLCVGLRLFPRAEARKIAVAGARRELFIRMLAGAVLVLGVTTFAASFGARLSGLLASFPVVSLVLAVFSHRQSGKEFAICLLRGIVLGWFAFLAFSVVLGLLLNSFPIAGSFLAAIAAALLTQLVSRALMRRT